jgi:hypothetical protein
MDDQMMSKQTTNKQIALTTPLELAARPAGGKIEFGAALETSAHTFIARTTEREKNVWC